MVSKKCRATVAFPGGQSEKDPPPSKAPFLNSSGKSAGKWIEAVMRSRTSPRCFSFAAIGKWMKTNM